MNEITVPKAWPAHIVREGERQVVEVPKELALPEAEYLIRRDGDVLIIEPKRSKLREFLDTIEPVDVDWPNVDEGLLPADDIEL